jgi:hypothetical protein
MRLPSRSLVSIPAFTSVPSAPDDLADFQKSSQLMSDKQYEAARKLLEPLAARLPKNNTVQYNLACCLARLEDDEAAIDALTKAVLAGWAERGHAEQDPDLALLRTSNTFKILLAKMDENRSKPFDVKPTIGFSSQYQWKVLGDRVEKQGLKYMLSTVLAVTSGRGNSVSEALTSLRRSVAADATQPRGTVYFMENSDVRSKTRQPAFISAVVALEGTPVTGKIARGALPEGKDDVAGVMAGSASFSWKKSGSTILPGAICEHLTSYGGIMTESSSQTPLSEFIRYGAAGSSGTVYEPLAVPAKFPLPFIHAHYARGCSLAEAFYQSVFGPYQLLIVGDPLCQPWAKLLEMEVADLQPNQTVSGKLTIRPKLLGENAAAFDHFELYVDSQRGTFGPDVRAMALDTNKFGDGWHELTVVAVAKGPIETRSRLVIPVIFDNGVGSVEFGLSDNAEGQVAYGESVKLQAKIPWKAAIQVAANGNLIGSIAGPEGTLEVDTRRLGMGPIRLQAAVLIEGKAVTSPPVLLQVTPPAMLPALANVDSSQLQPGLSLSVGGSKKVVVDSTNKTSWLADKKPAAGKSMELAGHFSVTADDLYQFQLRGNAAGELLVDGRSFWQAEDPKAGTGKWVMIPVHLAKGRHRFSLTGTVAKTPRLDIRFGNRGCQTVNKDRFKH